MKVHGWGELQYIFRKAKKYFNKKDLILRVKLSVNKERLMNYEKYNKKVI